MKREVKGEYMVISTVGEKAQAFVPAPLPLHPPIDWTPELRNKFDQAMLALGRLDGVSAFFRIPRCFFTCMSARKWCSTDAILNNHAYHISIFSPTIS